jgi:hypothetical protein
LAKYGSGSTSCPENICILLRIGAFLGTSVEKISGTIVEIFEQTSQKWRATVGFFSMIEDALKQ